MNKYCVFLIAVLLSIATSSYAQEDYVVPDMKEIEANIRNFDSSLYYPRLMKRYLENDTTLSLDEYRHLYLGYSFQEGYNPYRTPSYKKPGNEFYIQSDPSRSDCDSIVRVAKRAIADFPFDLRQINLLVYGYNCLEKTNEAMLWQHKLRSIIDAILSTGDGNTPETAMYVIYASHEYDIVNRLGLVPKKQSFVEPAYDFIEVESNNFKIQGVYFDVTRLMDEYDYKFAE